MTIWSSCSNTPQWSSQKLSSQSSIKITLKEVWSQIVSLKVCKDVPHSKRSTDGIFHTWVTTISDLFKERCRSCKETVEWISIDRIKYCLYICYATVTIND